ncbi:hypothetical protein [Streptomyces sp. NRRL S-237]|uniref:hypothetical protein n=1 Tax=Streptomyces sp. NRRL S-237 TaxID=1463895 RepID=UPI0004C60AA1|nr:hypothetical protein [Streptomyces sp. NRRL S-237]
MIGPFRGIRRFEVPGRVGQPPEARPRAARLPPPGWAGWCAFRIYPVVILTVVASLLLLPRAHTVIAGRGFEHGLVLQDLMGIPSVIGVVWTLTYEMVFYHFVTALFVMGRHRWNAPRPCCPAPSSSPAVS